MELTRLIVKGGVISPGELREVVTMAADLGLDSISFGSRQDIIFPKGFKTLDKEKMGKHHFVFPDEKSGNNIVSSYVSTDIFRNTNWLTGNRFLYILEQFKEQPTLKVNITDPKQQLVPLFTGHLNFIASEHEDYWYLYIRLPKWQRMEVYPVLIYSWDIATFYYEIERIVAEESIGIDMIFSLVSEVLDTNNRTIDKPLNVPFYPFPYYEGMNRMGIDQYWLGLYWRNNLYDLDFLKEMCDLCFDCKIGKISITPWKSFIVKGIPKERKLEWEKFLGKKGINVRHSLLELNWHLPVAMEWALNLKTFLVRTLDQFDISTYGLTFGLSEYNRDGHYFTSIVVEKNELPKDLESIKLRDTYNVLFAKNFDPNTREYIVHSQDIDKLELPNILIELSKKYFDELGNSIAETTETTQKKEKPQLDIYQCQECLTTYNSEYGDVDQGIAKGVLFANLPETYCCSLCESPKSNFKILEAVEH
ncbi:rubredoxin [Flavobacterium sp. GA093]|uniref:Rubredoxin n=1 Tax=Flavobacterium hydrocarbonoxydans TaxID=2683249 RepID=A0A6I4NKI1_9FLAO|nr:rubredoxin [Flavobacterium hydrocarbonoxydans]MWB93342.1 rubredoxin [Flavobacterium hydrocarbonoxydans]